MEFLFKELMGFKLIEFADLVFFWDYVFNFFFVELNDDFSDEDLKKFKFFCKGDWNKLIWFYSFIKYWLLFIVIY